MFLSGAVQSCCGEDIRDSRFLADGHDVNADIDFFSLKLLNHAAGDFNGRLQRIRIICSTLLGADRGIEIVTKGTKQMNPPIAFVWSA